MPSPASIKANQSIASPALMAATARVARVALFALFARIFLVDKTLNQSGEVNWEAVELSLSYSTVVAEWSTTPRRGAGARLPVKLVIGGYPLDW